MNTYTSFRYFVPSCLYCVKRCEIREQQLKLSKKRLLHSIIYLSNRPYMTRSLTHYKCVHSSSLLLCNSKSPTLLSSSPSSSSSSSVLSKEMKLNSIQDKSKEHTFADKAKEEEQENQKRQRCSEVNCCNKDHDSDVSKSQEFNTANTTESHSNKKYNDNKCEEHNKYMKKEEYIHNVRVNEEDDDDDDDEASKIQIYKPELSAEEKERQEKTRLFLDILLTSRDFQECKDMLVAAMRLNTLKEHHLLSLLRDVKSTRFDHQKTNSRSNNDKATITTEKIITTLEDIGNNNNNNYNNSNDNYNNSISCNNVTVVNNQNATTPFTASDRLRRVRDIVQFICEEGYEADADKPFRPLPTTIHTLLLQLLKAATLNSSSNYCSCNNNDSNSGTKNVKSNSNNTNTNQQSSNEECSKHEQSLHPEGYTENLLPVVHNKLQSDDNSEHELEQMEHSASDNSQSASSLQKEESALLSSASSSSSLSEKGKSDKVEQSEHKDNVDDISITSCLETLVHHNSNNNNNNNNSESEKDTLRSATVNTVSTESANVLPVVSVNEV